MKPWNKGIIHSGALIDKVNVAIENSAQKLTIGEIYSLLLAEGEVGAGRLGYKKFIWHLGKARRNGQVNSACIREGRGRSNHQRYGAENKFNVGDKVKIGRLQTRTPQWLRQELRLNVVRTITAISRTGRFVRYYLGCNGLGSGSLEFHFFRASELIPYEKGSVGRPRLKRHYNRKLASGNGMTPKGKLTACMLA